MVAFRATKILSTVGVDIPVDCGFQSYLSPGRSYALPSTIGIDKRSFQSYVILSTVEVGNLVDRSIQSYHNLVNFKNWYSCIFLSYLLPVRCYPSLIFILSELVTVALGAT